MLIRLSLILCLCGTALPAQTITFREAWDWPGPESLEWDPVLCGLWIAGAGPGATLVDRTGKEMDALSVDLFSIKALTATEEALLVADNSGRALWIDRDGTVLSPALRIPLPDAEGIAALPDGRLAAVADDPEGMVILNRSQTGLTLDSRLDPRAMTPPLFEPQGIAHDSAAGTFLVVDDEQGSDGLYEITTEGRILGHVDLSPYGRDAEGVALHAATGTLWIAFDEGNRIAVFDYVSGSGVIPEPDRCVPSLS